jgi:hypothetical protein
MLKKVLHGAIALLFTAGASFAAYNLSFDRLMPANAPPPVASVCGAAVDAGSSDTAGTITNVGTTTCTITFGTPFTVAPSCVVLDNTAVRASMTTTVSTTAIVVTAITAADRLSWICMAKAGG